MDYVKKMVKWGDTHHPKWVDFIRIALGGFLMYKGISFLVYMGELTDLMDGSMDFGMFALTMLGHFLVFAHLLGGLSLVLGMFVRAACIIQIPILLAAVIMVNTNPALGQPTWELLSSLIVLGLLIYFMVIGNGPLSFTLPEEEKRHGLSHFLAGLDCFVCGVNSQYWVVPCHGGSFRRKTPFSRGKISYSPGRYSHPCVRLVKKKNL